MWSPDPVRGDGLIEFCKRRPQFGLLNFCIFFPLLCRFYYRRKVIAFRGLRSGSC